MLAEHMRGKFPSQKRQALCSGTRNGEGGYGKRRNTSPAEQAAKYFIHQYGGD